MSHGDLPPSPRHYAPGTGSYRYVRFIEDWLGLRLGDVQKRLIRSLAENRRTIAVGGNGVGKSYGAGGAGSIAGLFCNADCTVNITSGSYGQLDDTIWKPIKSLHNSSKLPGRTLDNKRELKTELDEEWFLKCISPRYPADLEGRHNTRMIYIIEEADKPGITHEHIDSAESTLTDAEDRLLVIANPPEDETNVVYDLIQSEKWQTVRFSSFECHNVRVDIGEIDAPKIDGLIELSEIKQNWIDWNGEDWPGHEIAFTAHEDRDDLDSRWYRRRVGIMPPASAGAHRPFSVTDVEKAFGSGHTHDRPVGLGFDVARMGGDSNVLAGVFGGSIEICNRWSGVDHNVNEARVRQAVDREWDATLAVDAQGEGSALADRVANFYGWTFRFDAGGRAANGTKFYDCWTEGLYHLGQFLKNGGRFEDRRLREELLAAARVVEFEEKFYASRSATVLKATSKSTVKDQLGRSPDCLDAAMMAAWAANVDIRGSSSSEGGIRSF